MPERVVTLGTVPNGDTLRLRAIFARYPGGRLEARGVNPHAERSLFQLVRGLKGRYPITRVYRHVCQHDQDIGTCTIDAEG